MEDLAQLLNKLMERLDHLDARMSELESARVVLDERKIVAEKRELEGKTYYSTNTGGVAKVVRVPRCDQCSRSSEAYNTCNHCGMKLCTLCSSCYHNQIYCVTCLREHLPVSKQDFKILFAISHEVSWTHLADITKIAKNDLKTRQQHLLTQHFIERKRTLLFPSFHILDKGLEALAAYDTVYSQDGDIVTVKDVVRERSHGTK